MKVIVIIAALAATSAAQAPNAATVLANVQAYYANAKQYSAMFRQTVTLSVFGTQTKSDGELWAAKPDSVRFDYKKKVKQAVIITKSFVFDGTTAWMVDHDNKTITTQQTNATALPAAMSFLTGGTQLAKQFNVAVNGDVLELTPKQPSAQYKQLKLVVDPKDWHVKSSIVIASNGDTNEFDLFAPNTTIAIPASQFTVNPSNLPTYTVVAPASGRSSGSSSPPKHP